MAHHRKEPRHHLIFYLKVFDQDTGQQLGHMGDITTEGLMVMSSEPLEVEREYNLEIRVESKLTRNPSLKFRAEARWCRPDYNPDYYATGFHLMDRQAETQTAIEKLVKDIGFND